MPTTETKKKTQKKNKTSQQKATKQSTLTTAFQAATQDTNTNTQAYETPHSTSNPKAPSTRKDTAVKMEATTSATTKNHPPKPTTTPNEPQRSFMRYYDIQFEVPKAKKNDLLGASHQTTTEILTTLQQIDDSVVLYKFIDPDSPTADRKTVVKPEDIPRTSATAIGSYFSGFSLKAQGGMVYASIRLGFDADPGTFDKDADMTLKESMKARIFPKALQEASTTTIGWLMNSVPQMDQASWQEYFDYV